MTVDEVMGGPGYLLEDAASMHCVTVLSVIIGGVVTPCSQGSIWPSDIRT